MRSEGYTATCKHIAETAYNEWKIGAPCDDLLVKMAYDYDVIPADCRRELSKIITQAHQNRLLERSE